MHDPEIPYTANPNAGEDQREARNPNPNWQVLSKMESH